MKADLFFNIFRSEFYIRHAWIVPILLIVLLQAYFSVFWAGAAATVIDPSVHATAATHNGTTLTVVFTDDQTGYAFYRDSDGTCAYRKTTNGGTSWSGSPVTIDPQTDCIRIAVWYDRWTPGNATGTKIHVATMDTGSDDLYYTFLETATDATTTVLNITDTNQSPTFAAGANIHALTMATDGTLYVGVQDGGDSYAIRCSSNCTSNISNWTEAGTNPFDLANDWLLLAPLSGGDVLAVRFDISADDVQSKVWHSTSSSWDGSWANVDLACANNTTYDGHFGMTLNKNSNEIYLAYACDTQTVGGNDDDIRSARYSNSSRTWTVTSNALTNTTYGITGVKLGLDSNTGNLYAVYSARTTGNTANTGNVYYKISTSTMASWGAEQGPLNATTTDIYGMRLDGLNDERIYATWIDAVADSFNGNTVADLVITGYQQTSYAFFANQNATSVGSAFAGQDASTTMANQGDPFRLRFLIHATGEGADVGTASFKLQMATSTAGGCDTSFVGETYVDVATSTGDVRFYDNSAPADGANLAANGNDPTHSTHTIVNQTYEEANPFTNSAKFLGGQDAKWDFALVDFSAPADQTYCFRAVKSDGSLLSSYFNIPEIVKNRFPTIGSVTLNGDQSIALTEGTSTPIIATTTMTDANGNNDVSSASAVFYRSGAGLSCAANDNNCYRIGSCSISGCSAGTCNVSCTANFRYHADPTDSGTPWAAEDWRAAISVFDIHSASATASSSIPVDVLSLVGLTVTSTIPYGSLWPGSTTDPLAIRTGVTSTGNVSMDLTLYGSNMTAGANSIPVGQQRFASSTASFASGTVLTASPGQSFNLNIPKTISTTTPATSTLWWGITIPIPTVSGNYTGSNAFIGTVNSLPWP